MTWPLERDMRSFYGNPDANGDGRPDAAWEAANLMRVTPPWRMVLAWDTTRTITSFWAHKKVAPSLSVVLAQIFADVGESQAVIDTAGLHLFGGCYNFRSVRGGTRLSTHAYAAAIDLNPVGNPLGKKWAEGKGMIPMRTVERFEQAGWVWGGRFTKRPDCQHFQAARPV